MQERESNYDLLKIICMIAVVLIHVSGSVMNYEMQKKGGINTNLLIGNMLECIPRFAVPCFIMISGAFLLDNPQNRDFKHFYQKVWMRIGVQLVIFSILYFLYREGRLITKTLMTGKSLDLLEPLKDFLIGAPFYHMWYLYMILVAYLFVPFLIRIKSGISEQTYLKITLIALGGAILSMLTSVHKLNYDIGVAICYIPYLMLGNIIRKCYYESSIKRVKIISLTVFCIATALTILLRQITLFYMIADKDIYYAINGCFAPTVVIASISLFIFISNLKITRDISKIASLAIYIYLFHAGVLDLLFDFAKHYNLVSNPIYFIPSLVLIVLGISITLAYIYEKKDI